jgi:hypothetical protein
MNKGRILGKNEIVFENDTILVIGFVKGFDGVKMTETTTPVAFPGFIYTGDTNDFMGWYIYFSHFFQEKIFAISTVIQIDIIDNIDIVKGVKAFTHRWRRRKVVTYT